MFMMKKTVNDPAGQYYLQDVPEITSGFKLDAGNGFQFFLSYGALDRYGSGKWQQSDDQLSFHSRQWPGKDFLLLGSKATGNNHITVRITDKNPNVLRYVAASLQRGERGSWQPADNNGLIYFPMQPVQDIFLISEFSPERSSYISVPDNTHNYFELRFEPWIMEYFFTDFRLTLTKKGLVGKHPMLVGDSYMYKRKKGFF